MRSPRQVRALCVVLGIVVGDKGCGNSGAGETVNGGHVGDAEMCLGNWRLEMRTISSSLPKAEGRRQV